MNDHGSFIEFSRSLPSMFNRLKIINSFLSMLMWRRAKFGRQVASKTANEITVGFPDPYFVNAVNRHVLAGCYH